ncbi:MAG: family 43 glycosylhydrolase [Prolixibacteraceae bacterium]|nr:family 43 glycosylhydrolase [Prolixibacteraceae bacterium]
MKKLLCRSFLNGSLSLFMLMPAFAQNPICAPATYLADPSAKVFNDTLYLYTSTDLSCAHWCSWHHDVLWTTDLQTWQIQNEVFHSKGEKDEVPYNDNLLFAPDAAFANDSFYLYYCQPEREFTEGVAVSNSPLGPFTGGTALETANNSQIDPSVFIDDDGTAYYIWGQFSLKMARLQPNMRELDTETIQKDIITEAEHYFHEGAYMTKHKDLYYLVYADISREDKPTCLGYATSTSPFGPYTYRGVIIDNDGANPNNWNNHGSIAEYKGQWYVFYHRSTHACGVKRKTCVEKITILTDGTIPEVEMTSQGAGTPFKAGETLDAARACLLQGSLYISEEAPGKEILTNIHSDDKAIFKYLDFDEAISSVTLRMKVHAPCTLQLSAGKPWHHRLGDFQLEVAETSAKWKEYTFDIQKIQGTHALWLQVYGKNGQVLEIDWIRFNH